MTCYLSKDEFINNIGVITRKKLGSGSYGKVYTSDKGYAIKVQKTCEDVYIREISILNYLNHPNIIKLEGFFIDENNKYVYMVMEKADKTLYHLINDKEYIFTIDTITNIAFQLFYTLLYMKENNIMHRDIKPDNILLYGNNIKLCDFGISKYFITGDKSYTTHTNDVQTLWYRSPEVALNKKYNYSCELWSIAMIILELTCDEVFFKNRTFLMDYTNDAENELEFIIRWYTYLLGNNIPDIYLKNLKKEWIYKKSRIHKICRFYDSSIVKLLLKILKWLPDKRITIKDILQDECFEHLVIPSIPKNIDFNIKWYNQKTTFQTFITYEERLELFGWMWDISEYFKFEPQLVIIAFAIVDFIFTIRNVKINMLELLGITCISVVAKINYLSFYDYKTLHKCINYKFTIEHIKNMENFILKVNFNIINIFNNIFKYKLDIKLWNIITCILSMDNPISIDNILSKQYNDICNLINNYNGSKKLKQRCIEIIKDKTFLNKK